MTISQTNVRSEEVVKVLLAHFPEYLETGKFEYCDIDLPYTVWGGFGLYITDYIRSLPTDRLDDDYLVVRLFDFVNELMSTGDDDTQTIVVIELFENFYSYRKTIDLARRKLLAEHVPWLEKQGTWLRTIEED